MSIGVNLAKCVVAMRSEHLVQHAKHYLGHITAGVYRALLTALESKVRSVREDLVHYEDEDEEEEAQPVASVMEVAELVDPIWILLQASTVQSQICRTAAQKRKRRA